MVTRLTKCQGPANLPELQWLGPAYTTLALALVSQGRLEEAEPWVIQAERNVRPQADPRLAALLYGARGLLELGRGRSQTALDAFEAAEGLLVPLRELAPNNLLTLRAYIVRSLVRVGDYERAERILGQISLTAEQADVWRASGAVVRVAVAELNLARGDIEAAAAALAPIVDPSAQLFNPAGQRTQAFVLNAIVQDALGDAAAADAALERALDLAEPDGVLLSFLLCPAPDLLERRARRRTAHPALVAEIRNLLSGTGRAAAAATDPLREQLSDREVRVLRYLPTNLSVPEIAREVYLSANTVKTHTRNLYAKLGVHGRREAVERGRGLGLLAPGATASRGR